MSKQLTTASLAPAQHRMKELGLTPEDVTRETGYALQLINANRKFGECSTESILASVIAAASTGLTLNPAVQHACLIPRWSREGTKCDFEPMYRGLMYLAVEEGAATKFNIQAVHQNDTFKATPDNDRQPVIHEFDSFNRGKIVGYYSVATMLDGTKTAEFMSVEEICEVRNSSDGYRAFAAGKSKSHPWDSNFSEMAKKTIVKRHVKRLPSGKADSKLYAAVYADNRDYEAATVDVPHVEVGKPELTAEHPQWQGAVKAVRNGASRKQAEARFVINDETWSEITKQAAALEVAEDLAQTVEA